MSFNKFVKSFTIISSVLFVSLARSFLRNSNHILDRPFDMLFPLPQFFPLPVIYNSFYCSALSSNRHTPSSAVKPISNFLHQILYFQFQNSFFVFSIVSISLLIFSILLYLFLLYEKYCNNYFKTHVLLVLTSGGWAQLTVLWERD